MPVLNYAQQPKRTRRPLIVVAVVLGMVLVFFGYGAWRNYTIPTNIPCRTRILAVDALTGAPLNVGVGGPPIGRHDPWHMRYVSTADGIEVQWLYTDKACPITVEAKGYQKVELLLTPNSPQAVTVHLKH